MRSIKINKVLKKEQLFSLLTRNSETFLKENFKENVNNFTSSIVKIVLKNKLKAFEIDGCTFDIDCQWIDPSGLEEQKRIKQQKAKETWSKALDSIGETISEILKECDAGAEEQKNMLETMAYLRTDEVTEHVMPEETQLEKNVDNIMISIVINVDNEINDDNSAFNLFKTTIEDAITRICESEKLVKKEKLETQS